MQAHRYRSCLLTSMLDSSSPEALTALGNLRWVPRQVVETRSDEVVESIDHLLKEVATGAVRNIPQYLYEVSMTAKQHRCVRSELSKEPYRSLMMEMLNACAADGSIYKESVLVSQLQVVLCIARLYCEPFWRSVSKKDMERMGVIFFRVRVWKAVC